MNDDKVRQVIEDLDFNNDINTGIGNEDELIEKIIQKLLPKIKEIVKNEKSSEILTPSR